MRVMDELTEAAHRRTPSFHYAGGQSPRVGSSCASAVYHLIDWNLSKRFSSTKRIVADRPNQDAVYARRDASFAEHGSTVASKVPVKEDALKNSPSVVQSTPSPASVKSDATSKRSPGVVARLMGLESLPERTCNSSSKSRTPPPPPPPPSPPPLIPTLGPPPVLLQELLRLELQHPKKSLKDKLPGFTKSAKPVVDPKTGGAVVSQKKKPAYLRPYENSRGPRSSLQDDVKKQPFLARLQQTSMSPNPLSPILSPLGGRNTVRLLEAAVKALEPPAPRRKYSLTNTDSSHRGTQSDGSSASLRPEKRAFNGRSPANSATKTVRSQSRSGKDDKAVQSGNESSSPGSRSITSRARHESKRELSRTRFDTATLGASSRSVSPLQSSHRSKRVEESPPPLLRTHEASIRGFKTDLRDSPVGKKMKKNDSQAQAVELRPTPSPNYDPEPHTPDVKAESSPSIVPEKARGFRSIRFRSRSGKQVKDQGKHESPENPIAPSPPKAGFSYNMRFRKQGNNKKEGNETGEALSESIVLSPPKEAKVARTGFSFRKQGNKKGGNETGEALSESISRSPPKEAKVASAGFSSNMPFKKQGNRKEGNETGEALSEPIALSPAKEAKAAGAGFSFRKQGNKKEGNETGEALFESIALSPAKETKVAGAGFSYNVRIRKQGNKSEGNETGEVLLMKRTDSTWMRHLLRRPSSIPWTSKSSKKMNVEAMESAEPEEGMVHQESPSQEPALHSPTLQPARYRSIDDVFPELPMEEKDARSMPSPELADTIRAVEELQLLRQGDADYRSIERMFGKEFSRTLMAAELTSPEMSSVPESSPECRVPGTFPNSPKYKTMSAFSSRNQLNLHDMFEVVSGSLSHDSTGRRRSFCLSESREQSEEAESDTYSNLTPEHFENDQSSGATPPALREFEEKLAHEGVMSTPPGLEKLEEKLAQEGMMSTPPALKKFEEELAHEGVMSTPPALKKFEEKLAHESLMTSPPVLEKFEEKLAHEGVMTPPALKKFEEKLAQGFSDLDGSQVLCPEEFGQPSPVSVLQSPFLDELPTTPEASLAEAQLNGVGDTEPSAVEDDDEDEANENMATSKVSDAAMPETVQTDMIEQVILDISRIRSIDVTSIGLQPQTIAPVEPQEEQNYIREVLDAANLLREGEFSAVSQSLFDRLEFGSRKQGPSVRLERKLLFDSAREVVALEPWLKTSSFYVDLPMFPDLHANSKFRSPIYGEELVHEVHRMFCHWKDIAGHCLDDLIDYDMNVPEGRWVKFGHEVADVGLDIERTLLQLLITEVVDDLTSIIAATRG